MNIHKKAFTLVELIVVITILSILGTIAFISLQGYSKDARDSTRTSDLSTMKISLELFHLDAGKYPETTDGLAVTYSGTEVWTQGTFGNITKNSVDKLDKIPTDPLTGKEFTYSITNNKQEFLLGGLMEGGDYALNNLLLNDVNAGDTMATAIVTGNYNSIMNKTLTGVDCAILSLPSIITSIEGETDLVNIINSGGLVYNGYNNLPSNYTSSKFKVDGGFDFQTAKFVAYSDSRSCSPIYDANDDTARISLIEGLKAAYSGTIIVNEGVINNIVNIDIGDTTAVAVLGSTLVNNNLGGSVASSDTEEDGGGASTCVDINNGLIGLWHFDGDLFDSSVSANDGINSGASINTTGGLINGSVTFSGEPTDIDIPNSAELTFGNETSDIPFSIGGWVNTSDVTNFRIIGKGTTISNTEYVFGFGSNDVLYFALYDNDSGNISRLVTDNPFTSLENGWHNIFATYDGTGIVGSINIYVDGVLITLSTHSIVGSYAAMHNDGSVITLGSWLRGDATWKKFSIGDLDELSIYDRELNITEILEIYDGGIIGKPICNP
ncbi:MAG: prepilin-type N-terminal cleavage/methylation domain-containing protein [Candidatus Gracilibacteria bacterium]